VKGGVITGLGAVVGIIIAIWLFIIVLKVTFKLIGLAIIIGLAAFIYIAVKDKIGGGNAR
jgi:predicted membrane protein